MDSLQFSNFQRAEVLTQALPYIKQYVGKVNVPASTWKLPCSTR